MKNGKYDLLLVGSGLYNAIIAREAAKDGFSCLVLEKKEHIGGCLYCTNREGINVHKYGPHIFHTSEKGIWDYMSELCTFNHFRNMSMANYKGELYNLPFNMNTFHQLWGINTPQEAIDMIERQKLKGITSDNLEEQALSMVGKDVFEKLIKGYTEKQWGKSCRELPAFIIKRIPLRFTYDNNYFSDCYQGIPIGGYNPIIEKCFAKAEIVIDIDFLSNREFLNKASVIVYTGAIDAYFDYCFGKLEYRTLEFEEELLDIPNYQGVAIMNYTDRETPYTRIVEHKHFEFGEQPVTIISREYPVKWDEKREPYYPVNTPENNKLYRRYLDLAQSQRNIFFCGRLGEYKYYDMDKVVSHALKKYKEIKRTLSESEIHS